ncbi:MAG TPA: prephenate dehydratase domain-containing protein [Patescibacteria group bacterium]|nr:prephenate dehydratase domain-containing protein [Patescibacteria group bacterium]
MNNNGGIVDESIDSVSKHNFKIIDKYSINIEQCLLGKVDVKLEDIKFIMSHPQGFEQCKNSLNKKFLSIKKIVGKNKEIDPAYLAKELSENKLNKYIAIIGNRRLAEIYNLQILQRNLQDITNNWTTFLLVSKV